MILAEALLTALRARGAREIFGIPGDFALPFFKVIEDSRILPYYTLSHEPGVGFAADAAGRFNRGLGVAVITYGAGAFNMVNATAAAYAEKSPLVVISGAPGTSEGDRGLLLHHQAKTLDSQLRVFREITCDQAVLDDPATAPGEIARVLQNCKDHSQPVYIEVPRDMVRAEIAEIPATVPMAYDADALSACAGEIFEALRDASSPVMMVGVEIRRHGIEDKVARLARRLQLPVVTSFMGRGLLANTDIPLIGTYLGVAGNPEITELVENSDALLLLGVILSDTNLGVSQRHLDLRKTIQALDGQVSLAYHTYRPVPLEALVDKLLDTDQTVRQRAVPNFKTDYPRGLKADDEAITPTDIARGINDMMDLHGAMPIAADMGDCLFTAMDIEHTQLTAPGYYAGMGYGVPAGLGIQATTGKRPLILVGDGAFQMTGWELGNCRRYGWTPIVVVFNNESWEMLRAFQPESTFNDLDDWRFADMAPLLGGVGIRAKTRKELSDALVHAAEIDDRFVLIEAMLPRGAMSTTLSRFVAGVKRLHGKAK